MTRIRKSVERSDKITKISIVTFIYFKFYQNACFNINFIFYQTRLEICPIRVIIIKIIFY